MWDVFWGVVIERDFQVNTPDMSREGLCIGHSFAKFPAHTPHVLPVAAPLMELLVARLALEQLVQVDDIDVVVQLPLVKPGLVTLRALERPLFVMNNLDVLLEVALAS